LARLSIGGPPLSTDGIDICRWNLSLPGEDAPQAELSAWDFAGARSTARQIIFWIVSSGVLIRSHFLPTRRAGQEIYYSTHKFFLSERSLFLVVFNLLAPEQAFVEYWYILAFF
jgi:hypothetical protein